MENSVRPKARPKNFGRKSAIESAIAKIMGESGRTISDADREKIMGMMGQSGKTISDADRQSAMDRASMLEALEFGEMGMMSDADLARLRKQLGMKRGGKVKKMKDGGLVGGQVKLDKNKDGQISGADFKMMEDGGAVTKKKGKSKKSGGAVCRGAGAAIKGTRFSGVR